MSDLWEDDDPRFMSQIIDAGRRKFVVAMDYDDTFTSCWKTWTRVIEVLRAAGADVICVTFRSPETPVTRFPGKIYYTSGRPKWEYMAEQGVDVKVWIDDWPALIGENPMRQVITAAN